MRLGLGAALAGMMLLSACGGGGDTGNNSAAEAMVVVTVHTAAGPRSFTVEVADTEAEQEKGLMYRDHIAPDGGMLVAPFPPNGGPAQEAVFWSKNVPIPVDFLFIRADGTIARVAENPVPLSETRIHSGEPVTAILEIRGGRAAELGIAAGDSVTWPGQKRE